MSNDYNKNYLLILLGCLFQRFTAQEQRAATVLNHNEGDILIIANLFQLRIIMTLWGSFSNQYSHDSQWSVHTAKPVPHRVHDATPSS